MAGHDLRETGEGFYKLECSICGRRWKKEPTGDCVGVRVYGWGEWPEHLKTKAQLGEAGMSTGKTKLPPPAGAVMRSKSPGGVMWLYDIAQATPKAAISQAQRDHLDAAREKAMERYKCEDCGEWLHPLDQRRGICHRCDLLRCRKKAAERARAWLADERIVILDTETTGLYDAEIVEIAIIDGTGAALVHTLVRPNHPEKLLARDDGVCAADIHGIRPEDVQDAPTWDDVWPVVREALRDRLVLIYNAEFDWSLIRRVAKRYETGDSWSVADVRCIMRLYAQWYGEWSNYWDDFKWQPLHGGHRAMGDCLAALGCLHDMAGDRE